MGRGRNRLGAGSLEELFNALLVEGRDRRSGGRKGRGVRG